MRSSTTTIRVQATRRPLVAAAVLSALGVALAAGTACANPEGAQVVAGQASFNRSSNQLLITNSPGTIINWQQFSILPGELTRFIQQSSSSTVLNRITGQDPSKILGALESNGKVALINPNGIVFGAGSRVDVNGLVASSLPLADADFLAGRWRFSSTGSSGDVINHGAIRTPSGGQVYLIAPNVTNDGLISAPNGDVLLAAGRSVNLADSNDPNVRVVVSASGDQALNLGQIVAQSGQIGIYGALVNQAGLVSANSAVAGANGKVILKASDTTRLEAGSSTSATGAGTGGKVEVLGNQVQVVGDAAIDVSGNTGGGTALVGGDAHGDNPAVQNASLTYISPDARISADALRAGNGGKVIVWSDQQTRMYGALSARGAGVGGNGGFVETSSRGYLDFRGRADLRAAQGLAGTLLLDPTDISIQSGPSSGDMSLGATISGSNASSVLSVSDLVAQLAIGDVIVQTASSATTPNGGTITVAAPLSWSTATSLTLHANQSIYINAPITATSAPLYLESASGNILQSPNSPTPASIRVASLSAYAPGGWVDLTLPTNHVSGSIAGQSASGFGFANESPLSIGTVGSLSGITNQSGVLSLKVGDGGITQTALIWTPELAAVATGGDIILTSSGNYIPVVAGSAGGGGGFYMTSGSGITVGSVAAVGSNPAVNGITSVAGINLTSDVFGDITLGGPVNAGTNAVQLSTFSGSIRQGTNGLITAGTLTLNLQGSGDIGASGSPLLISAQTLIGSASQGSIYIRDLADLTIQDLQAYGALMVASDGAIGTADAVLCACTVNITGSSVQMAARNSLAIGAGAVVSSLGDVSLYAGYDPTESIYGPAPNDLTINGSVVGANVNLAAGGAIQTPGTVIGNVTRLSGQYASSPTLDQCIAAPSTPGCSSILPTLTQCVAAPATPGCSVVLPSIGQCSEMPSMPGCSAVLPTLTQCTATPSTPGCSAVLPTLEQCVASPSASGCSAVLPTLGQCTSAPSTPGCSAVLPPLPSLAQCVATPTLSGCTTVLPSLAQCIVTPAAEGCGAVLPPFSQCTAAPTTPGCSAVLPTVASCLASPSTAGCGAVLPTVAQCAVDPTVAGCSEVLPMAAQCVANPSLPLCLILTPPRTSNPISPVTLASTQVINTLIAATPTGQPGTSSTKDSAGTSSNAKNVDDKTSANLDKSSENAKKLYCN